MASPQVGREEYPQRLITTLIVGGDPPPWNTRRSPSEQGHHFLQLLDNLAHGGSLAQALAAEQTVFVDEYLLPKVEETAHNGWPDWAVLWPGRVWIIELKTEATSHRADQLPYYLLLASAAHGGSRLDLTYLTGPLTKPAPDLLTGQRYSHLTWAQVLPLIEAVWGDDARPEVTAYVGMARTVVNNLGILRPAEQRERVLGLKSDLSPTMATPEVEDVPSATGAPAALGVEGDAGPVNEASDLLGMARATAADGRQRGRGVADPGALERSRDAARAQIGGLPADDKTRFVLPWPWRAGGTGGSALTAEGKEFGTSCASPDTKECRSSRDPADRG